ncbi:MAG: ATP-dependent Lon protease [Acidimicrobiaceae bacterium]|nr:ATP-dependent Lon protease [Acidimicrobiaceae bacterium]
MATLDTSTLPLVPLNAGVVLPGMIVTLALETPEAQAGVDAATGSHNLVVLVPRLSDAGETGTATYARVGTVALVENAAEMPGGYRAAMVRGLHRAVIGAGVASTGNALWVSLERAEEPNGDTQRSADLAREYRVVVESILEQRGARRFAELLHGVTESGAVADTAGYWPELSIERKVELLETLDVELRLEKVVRWVRDMLGELQLKERIRSDVADGMEKTQREFLLRQQMAAIRKELGELDENGGSDDYRKKLETLAAPDAVRSTVEKEIDRLERTSDQSPESGWIRTWLDTIFELPWGHQSDDRLEVSAARSVLDADHTGLDDVKDRIVEYLAVRKLRDERGLDALDQVDDNASGLSGPSASRRGTGGMILSLVGPPGVGKTSLGESVARAMGRRFVRVALGGVRDEAEIRGHRRTYVGAMPGRIVRALKEAGTMNPVVLLDEVDKLGADWRGDPSSALLEVLDPAQNHTFRDHYLDVDLDLSNVLFLATANMAEQIPGALLDRMEVVHLDGYTEDEKVAIARDHLLARQLRANGLTASEVVISDDAMRTIVTDYTREAGVRSLERQLGKLLRKAATKLAASQEPGTTDVVSTGPIVVNPDGVRTYLGRARYFSEVAERTSVPGVATGLAVTGAGGDVLFVEATAMSGDSGLTITGQLGDVMKESAEIALSYVRSHAAALDLPAGAFEKRRFHVHVPAGAIPKDGPSAGVTMTTALVSLLTDRAIRPEVGMTGEITLQGKVLPIGGVKQKVLAAHRAGLTEVILPARNGPDLDDVPEAVREQMTFHLASDISEVLAHALVA